MLQDLGGRPLLRFMLDRLADLRVDELVVATSTLDRDDAVVEIARDAGRPGRARFGADVLDRFVGALDAHPADHVVRLTADCPLADPVLIEAVLARHLDRGADYTSNVFPRTFPRGLDCEVMTAAALRAAHAEATDPAEREHVTPFLYRRPGAVRAREHAQRRCRSAVRVGRSTPPTTSRSCDGSSTAWTTASDRRRVLLAGSVVGRSVRAYRRRDRRRGRARSRGPGAQRVLPRVPQRRRRGAAQPLAPR